MLASCIAGRGLPSAVVSLAVHLLFQFTSSHFLIVGVVFCSLRMVLNVLRTRTAEQPIHACFPFGFIGINSRTSGGKRFSYLGVSYGYIAHKASFSHFPFTNTVAAPDHGSYPKDTAADCPEGVGLSGLPW